MNILPDQGPLGRLGSAAAPERGADARRGESRGEDFRARLEALQEQAAALQAQSRGADRPAGLRVAVDSARVALVGALSLGDELLEAYRGATAGRPDTGAPRPPGADVSGRPAEATADRAEGSAASQPNRAADGPAMDPAHPAPSSADGHG